MPLRKDGLMSAPRSSGRRVVAGVLAAVVVFSARHAAAQPGNTAARANAYDDAWQDGASGWVANARAILAGASNQVPGLVLWIGDSLTRDPALGAWAQNGAGKTAEDQAITNWMHAGVIAAERRQHRRLRAGVAVLLLGAKLHGRRRPRRVGLHGPQHAGRHQSRRLRGRSCRTARRIRNALNLTTMLAALPKAQFAIPEVNLTRVNPAVFTDFRADGEPDDREPHRPDHHHLHLPHRRGVQSARRSATTPRWCKSRRPRSCR